jgi:hypothetical protein
MLVDVYPAGSPACSFHEPVAWPERVFDDLERSKATLAEARRETACPLTWLAEIEERVEALEKVAAGVPEKMKELEP